MPPETNFESTTIVPMAKNVGETLSLAGQDADITRVLVAKEKASTADIHEVAFADPQGEMRARVAEDTAKVLGAAGKLDPRDITGVIVASAIKNQYEAGGAKAADAIAQDITNKLPNGMTLKIKEDDAFAKKVAESCKKNGEPLPGYIRTAELFDKDGKSLGKIGVTIKAEPRPRPGDSRDV